MFAKFRSALIDQGRARRYLLYAAGEILLVVIGILLALQVNNWNEERKLRLKEKEIYLEILSDLDLTEREVTIDRDGHLEMAHCTQSLRDHLLAQRPTSDSIVDLLLCASRDLQAWPKSTGYQALNSIGLDLLSNDSVRREITSFYELSLQRLVSIGRQRSSELVWNLYERMAPYLAKYLVVDPESTPWNRFPELGDFNIFNAGLRNYEEMLSDNELHRALNVALLVRLDKIARHDRVLENIRELKAIIRRELERIN